MLKFSIVIPVYNQEKYILDTLDYIGSQTFKDFECILVDDGSTDATVKLIRRAVKDDRRFKLIQQQNQGSAVARNKGLDVAEGEYLIFLDSDDIFAKDLLKVVAKKVSTKNPDILVFNYGVLNEGTSTVISPFLATDTIPPKEFQATDISERIFNTLANNVWNKAFKREFILKNNLHFDEELRRAQDALFTNQALVLAGSIVFENAALMNYRSGIDGSAWSTSYKYPLSTLRYIIKLHDFLESQGVLKVFQKSFDNLCINDMNGTLEKLAAYPEFTETHELAKKMVSDYGLLEKPAGYFYNDKATDIIRAIAGGPEVFLEQLISRLQKSELYFMNETGVKLAENADLRNQLDLKNKLLKDKELELYSTRHELDAIHGSKAWKLIQLIRRILHPFGG